jgi:hypothetical protein
LQSSQRDVEAAGKAGRSPDLSRRFVSVEQVSFTKVSGGKKSMRQFNLFSSFSALETLELKLSPALLSVGAVAAAALSPANPHVHAGGDVNDASNDPLPNPEPPPGPDPGDNPPVVYPILPPSGPSGPGS